MRRVHSSAILGVAFMASIVGASAQTTCPTSGVLTSVQGNVLLNSGAGFSPAQAGSVLRASDLISVRGEGSATIDFGGGRVVSIPASSTNTVRALGCAPVTAQQANTTAMIVGGIAGVAAIGGAIALANNGGGSDPAPLRPISR